MRQQLGAYNMYKWSCTPCGVRIKMTRTVARPSWCRNDPTQSIKHNESVLRLFPVVPNLKNLPLSVIGNGYNSSLQSAITGTVSSDLKSENASRMVQFVSRASCILLQFIPSRGRSPL